MPRSVSFADPGGLHLESAYGVERSAGHAIAGGPLSTGMLSPVTIDSSIEVEPEMIRPSTGTFSLGRTRRWSADPDLCDGNFHLFAVPHNSRSPGLEADKLADGLRGLGFGSGFQEPTQEDERDNYGSCVEIDFAGDGVRGGGLLQRSPPH